MILGDGVIIMGLIGTFIWGNGVVMGCHCCVSTVKMVMFCDSVFVV